MMRLPKDIVSMIDIMLHKDLTKRLIEQYHREFIHDYSCNINCYAVQRISNAQYYNYRLLSWDLSNARMWGCPLTTIHTYKTCTKHGCACFKLPLRLCDRYAYTLKKDEYDGSS